MDTLGEIAIGENAPANKAPVADKNSVWTMQHVQTLKPSPQAEYSGANTTIAVDNTKYNIIQAKLTAPLDGNAATLSFPTAAMLDQETLRIIIDNSSGTSITLNFDHRYRFTSPNITDDQKFIQFNAGEIFDLSAVFSTVRNGFDALHIHYR